MTNNAELQAKIAAVTGKIKQHKHHPFFQPAPPPRAYHDQPHSAQPYRGNSRWSPYGRGERGGVQTAHKNRTLVLSGPSKTSTPVRDPAVVTTASPALVSARSTNHQLMTKDTYEREQKQRIEHEGQQRVAKRLKRNTQDQHRILSHLNSTGASISREIAIEGVLFRLAEEGSKLTRVHGKYMLNSWRVKWASLSGTDIGTDNVQTPKKTTIAGVDFYRTKHDNLIRASALKASARYWPTPRLTNIERDSPWTCDRPTINKPQCENFTKHGTSLPTLYCGGHPRANLSRNRDGAWLTGTCPYGSQCRFAHDPDKVVICKDFLRTGTCALGSNCDMSHEMTYHRVSACQYFLRGNCTKSACRYPHLFVSPAAPVCRAFATLGFCAKGPDCDKRHVLECPDHANHGFCAVHAKGKCSLPHPERASIIRKAAKRQSKTGSDAESDISSDAEDKIDEMDDIDSDDEDVILTGFSDNLHELSQQNDFIGFT
ncbi:hypothetical protein LTR48_002519 [Friedmanniomyces endolithicus]|uniref:C3H1-type domain-containing protein n=1 Tax=Rachicladosporium monterosium TaxID=1507873 RepID=A0ABR0LAZ1_9PEZI|nr:hypothetical protein LTR48_002519 [Friedmanniomyces endolithicus]KAK5146177.1 hypothetical protein LTR32_002188 [Rachicladosporium monterosium]